MMAGLGDLTLLRLKVARQVARMARTRKSSSPAIQMPSRLDPAREWRLVTDITLKELSRASTLVPLQASAARQIDAAEHAFNRLIADLATVNCHVVPPTFRPARQLVREPVAAPHRQPLAA